MPGNQEGGDPMPKKKTSAEIQAEREKLEQELAVKTQRLKELKRRGAELERKERTHRLCTHGAMLEQYLDPASFTDAQIESILQVLFRRAETAALLESAKRQTAARDEA